MVYGFSTMPTHRQPFPSPRMEPTAFACDGCGLATIALHVHRRPNGDQHWLCYPCSKRAYGSVPVAVVQQVAEDRAKHGGGPRVLREPAAT